MKLLASGKICLEIRRLETEGDYLEHQLRQLRAATVGDLKVRIDVEPIRETSQSPYAVLRLRAIGEDLRPAYGILYPQDQFRLSRQALEIAGPLGLACLWIDGGKRANGRYHLLQRRYDTLDWIELMGYLKESCNQNCLILKRNRRSTGDQDTRARRYINGIQLQTPERDRVPPLFTRARPTVPAVMRPAFAGRRGIGRIRVTQEPPEAQPEIQSENQQEAISLG